MSLRFFVYYLTLFIILILPSCSLEESTEEDSPYSTVKGVIHNQLGQSISNAQVALLVDNVIELRVSTDNQGSFLLKDIEKKSYEIQIEHPNYHDLQQDLELNLNSHTFDFALDRKYTISGAVRGGSSTSAVESVKGASLMLQILDQANQWNDVEKTSTDAAGRFNFDDLKVGKYRITIESDVYVTKQESISISILSEANLNVLYSLTPFFESFWPNDKKTNVSVDQGLSWQVNDSHEDIVYDVYLSKQNPPTVRVAESIKDNFFIGKSLERKTVYYWRLIATLPDGTKSESEVLNFSTIF